MVYGSHHCGNFHKSTLLKIVFINDIEGMENSDRNKIGDLIVPDRENAHNTHTTSSHGRRYSANDVSLFDFDNRNNGGNDNKKRVDISTLTIENIDDSSNINNASNESDTNNTDHNESNATKITNNESWTKTSQGIIPITEGWEKIYQNGIKPFLDRVVSIGNNFRAANSPLFNCESTIPQQQYSMLFYFIFLLSYI